MNAQRQCYDEEREIMRHDSDEAVSTENCASGSRVCRKSLCTPLRSFYASACARELALGAPESLAFRAFFVAEGCYHLGFLIVLQGSGVALDSFYKRTALGTFKNPPNPGKVMGDSWIEPRSKIPFVGIIAIVVIVAVVAIFIKTQLGPLFPASDVKVETAGKANVAGHASASFYGMREVQLKQAEYLQGALVTGDRSIGITVDPASKLLIIAEGSRREEVQLHENGDKLSATFEYNGVQTTMDVSTADRYLTYVEPGRSVAQLQVPLSHGRRYQGLFTVRNRQYLLQFYPEANYATVIGNSADRIDLARTDATFAGNWDEAGKQHPVSIDAEKMIATIEEVY
jgi:hypothetical protein